MALLADEVEAGRRLMTAQARLALGEIDDAVAAGTASTLELGAGRFDPRDAARLQPDVDVADLETVTSDR